jgi:hypothetical protein
MSISIPTLVFPGKMPVQMMPLPVHTGKDRCCGSTAPPGLSQINDSPDKAKGDRKKAQDRFTLLG